MFVINAAPCYILLRVRTSNVLAKTTNHVVSVICCAFTIVLARGRGNPMLHVLMFISRIQGSSAHPLPTPGPPSPNMPPPPILFVWQSPVSGPPLPLAGNPPSFFWGGALHHRLRSLPPPPVLVYSLSLYGKHTPSFYDVQQQVVHSKN